MRLFQIPIAFHLLNLSLICRLHVDRAPFDLGVLHSLEDFSAVLSRHLHEGILVVHVDRADQLAWHAGLPGDRTENVSRLDAVFFTDVDEETYHPFLRAGIVEVVVILAAVVEIDLAECLLQKCRCNIHCGVIRSIHLAQIKAEKVMEEIGRIIDEENLSDMIDMIERQVNASACRLLCPSRR